VLIGEILVIPAQDTLRLGQGPVRCAHGLIQGNVVRRMKGRVPHDHLQFLHNSGSGVNGCSCAGCR
jgi:hypothetical protein